MKSLLIVNLKCATKPTYLRTSWVIFEICENYQAVSSPRGFSRTCDADGGSVRVGNYALYTCTVIYTVYSLPFVESTAVQMYMFMLKSV